MGAQEATVGVRHRCGDAGACTPGVCVNAPCRHGCRPQRDCPMRARIRTRVSDCGLGVYVHRDGLRLVLRHRYVAHGAIQCGCWAGGDVKLSGNAVVDAHRIMHHVHVGGA